jgi:hypothetical protein
VTTDHDQHDVTGELFLPSRTANQYLAYFYRRVPRTNIWPDIGSRYATVKIVHQSEIHHKSSPPRGWDACTFVGADLRVCDLWVRSRSLAATRGRSGLHSTPGLASTVRTVPGNTPGSHGPGNPPCFTMIHPFPTLGFDPRGTRFMMNFLTGELFFPWQPRTISGQIRDGKNSSNGELFFPWQPRTISGQIRDGKNSSPVRNSSISGQIRDGKNSYNAYPWGI